MKEELLKIAKELREVMMYETNSETQSKIEDELYVYFDKLENKIKQLGE